MNTTGLKKLEETEAVNCSFFSEINMFWYDQVILNYLPPEDKELVFLPCGRANSTRNKKRIRGKRDPNGILDPRKFISEGTGHDFMKSVREDNGLEKVILSEPLTLIPYAIEGHPARPDYNLPPEYLSIQGERCFINQVSQWLLLLKQKQPNRTNIFYVGGKHHFLILYFANKRAGFPFRLIFSLPANGLKDYTAAADTLVKMIYGITEKNIIPEMPAIEEVISKFLKSRGRYTHRRFWKEVIVFHVPSSKEREANIPTINVDGMEFIKEIEAVDLNFANANYARIYSGEAGKADLKTSIPTLLDFAESEEQEND